MAGPQFLVYFWHPDWLPDQLCSAVLQVGSNCDSWDMPNLKNPDTVPLYVPLISLRHKMEQQYLLTLHQHSQQLQAVVGIPQAGSCGLWFVFLGGLNSRFQSYHTQNSYNMYWTCCNMQGIFPLLKISMVQLVTIIYLHFTWNLIRAQTKTPKEASSPRQTENFSSSLRFLNRV